MTAYVRWQEAILADAEAQLPAFRPLVHPCAGGRSNDEPAGQPGARPHVGVTSLATYESAKREESRQPLSDPANTRLNVTVPVDARARRQLAFGQPRRCAAPHCLVCPLSNTRAVSK